MSSEVPQLQQPRQRRRRRLLGLEPIFEGGWLHKGKRAQQWDVEPKLFAFALFGDVTVDIARARSMPTEITVRAWALFRDIDIIVPSDAQVELTGGGIRGHLTSHMPDVSTEHARPLVRVEGHTLLADVTVRPAEA
jgi:hypothetical protein